MVVDVMFQLCYAGGGLHSDHGYSLFSAISGVLEQKDEPAEQWLHENKQIGLHTINGYYMRGTGKMIPSEKAEFGLRLPEELVPRCLKLAGQKLQLKGESVRVGIGRIQALAPEPALYSHLVTTKNGSDSNRFDEEIARQLTSMGVNAKATRVPVKSEKDKRDPSRRIFRIRDKKIVGYSVLIEGLTAEESLKLQEIGLGGRRRMGCGVFVKNKEGLKKS